MKIITKKYIIIPLIILCASCVASRKPITKTYASKDEISGEFEYITINSDFQFFYNRPSINRSILGQWKIKRDTIILCPSLMYYFDGDSLEVAYIQYIDPNELPFPYWVTKCKVKGKNGSSWVDISEYPELQQDSIFLPPSRRTFLELH